jgi:hypothetical protein
MEFVRCQCPCCGQENYVPDYICSVYVCPACQYCPRDHCLRAAQE